MKNLAVIISSGKESKEKVLTALTFANVARKNKFFGDVKLIFFGPSEKLIAENDRDVMKAIDDFSIMGDKPLACQAAASNFNILDDIKKIESVKIEMVGPVIRDLAEKDYVVMTF
ncbi:MAG: DsrE family protein [Thermoplasmata archaeon]